MIEIELEYAEDIERREKSFRKAVRCVMWDSLGMLLMIRTNKGDYKFPGGGQISGESDIETVFREVKEESGYYDFEVKELIGTAKQNWNEAFKMESYYYLCTLNSKQVESQKLDEYEKKLDFVPEFITPYKALLENKKILDKGNPDNIMWLERETLFLEKLIESDFYQYKFIKPSLSDMNIIQSLIKDAQAYLKQNGVDQWQDGFPSVEVLEEDIKLRTSFLFCKNKIPVAFFVVSFDREEEYHHSLEGSLKLEGEYATIHRTAVSAQERSGGISHFLFDFAMYYAYINGFEIMRIDTHKDNRIMQHIISREGFDYVELITLDPSRETMKRLVYERLI